MYCLWSKGTFWTISNYGIYWIEVTCISIGSNLLIIFFRSSIAFLSFLPCISLVLIQEENSPTSGVSASFFSISYSSHFRFLKLSNSVHKHSWDYILKYLPFLHLTCFSLEFFSELEPGLEGPEGFAIFEPFTGKVTKYSIMSTSLGMEPWQGPWKWGTLNLHLYQLHSKCVYVCICVCMISPDHIFSCPWIPFPCPSSLTHSLSRYLIECVPGAYSELFAEVSSLLNL